MVSGHSLTFLWHCIIYIFDSKDMHSRIVSMYEYMHIELSYVFTFPTFLSLVIMIHVNVSYVQGIIIAVPIE